MSAIASGNNHTGVVSGATWATSGKFGPALSFDGSGGWVTIVDASDLDLTTGMTLEAWVFPTTTSGVRDILIKEGSSVDIYNLYARNWRGRPESNVLIGGTNRTAEGTALAANTWTHVAGTYDGTTLRLYINGVQAASTAVSGPIASSTGPLRIGGNSLWGEFFQGLIDEVRIYDRALSQAEIQTDMVTPIGLGTLPPPPPGPDEVGQWSEIIQWPIVPIHMSYLTTGEVIAWDGFGFAPGSATLWDPASGQFTPVPNGPNLFCAGHILMADGRLLVLGGHADVYVGITATTIYNPAARTWSAAAPMSFSRWYPTATALPDGRALVMSGNTSCETCIADTPEIFNPATNSWTRLDSARLANSALSLQLCAAEWKYSCRGRLPRFDADPRSQYFQSDLASCGPGSARCRQRGHVCARQDHEVRILVGERTGYHAIRRDHLCNGCQSSLTTLALNGADGDAAGVSWLDGIA